MSDYILGIILTNVVTIIVVLLNGASTRNKLTNEIKTNQAVMNTELGSLKEEVKDLKTKVEAHNNFGLKIENLDTRLKTLEGRN